VAKKSYLILGVFLASAVAASVLQVGVRGFFSELLLPPLYAWEYLHRTLDPRQPPSPEPQIRDSRPLREQAAEMRAALKKDFLIEDGKLLVLNRPDSHLGDVCLWHPIARSVYPASLPTEPGGIQYFRDDQWQWKEDASVDSTSGWMFGVMTALRFLPSRRQAAQALLKKYADTLIANGYRLENSDGSATRFHRVGGAWINSPVGVLTTMAALRALAKTPGGELYLREWNRFRDERQDRWAGFASGPALWRNMTTNHNIGHLALASALLIEDDLDTAGRFANGLARLGRLTMHEGNSFWIYLSIWILEDFRSRRGVLPEAAESWLAGKNAHFERARPAMFEWDYPENMDRPAHPQAAYPRLAETRRGLRVAKTRARFRRLEKLSERIGAALLAPGFSRRLPARPSRRSSFSRRIKSGRRGGRRPLVSGSMKPIPHCSRGRFPLPSVSGEIRKGPSDP
jgi:hypothetical protein